MDVVVSGFWVVQGFSVYVVLCLQVLILGCVGSVQGLRLFRVWAFWLAEGFTLLRCYVVSGFRLLRCQVVCVFRFWFLWFFRVLGCLGVQVVLVFGFYWSSGCSGL